MAAISAARSVNTDPPRSLGVDGPLKRSRDANEAVNFLPRCPNISCHAGGCLCRIGHFKGSAVFAMALGVRDVRSEERLISGRSGSGPVL